MMTGKFTDGASRTLYLALRPLPGILLAALFAAAGTSAWKPAAQIARGMPLLIPAVFLCYAIPLLLSFILFSGKFRFSFWFPFLSLIGLAASLVFRFFPATGSGAEFERLSRTFVAAASWIAFTAALVLGALLARKRAMSLAEILPVAGLGLLALIALDGTLDSAAAPLVAFGIAYYVLHSLFIEQAFARLPPKGSARSRHARAAAARYALMAASFLIAFLLIARLGGCAVLANPAGGEASPYDNKGRPRDKDDAETDEQLQKLSGAGSYIHSLKPEVKLDDKYNPGEKTLLYNVYVKSFDGEPVEAYYRSRAWKDFKTLYLGRFVLSAYDPESHVFTLDSKEPERASFFGEPLPFDRVKLSPNAVVPLGKGGEGDGTRKRMGLVVSLTPFVDGDEAISPDYPLALSVLMRMTDAEARRSLADSIRRYGDSSLDVERVYVSAYALEARALPNDFAGLDDALAARKAEDRPDLALSAEDNEYYTIAGGDEDALSLRALARSVTEGARGPVEAAALIRKFFVSSGKERPAAWGKPFTYDLDPGKAKTGESDIRSFVFDHRRGYCQYYALASAVMLRSLGIPARVIAGYLGIDRSTRNPGYYYIYSNQAHAWTELFVDGLGWVQFDATPPPPPSLEGVFGPPGPDGTPPEFPDAPEWSVVSFMGKVVSAEGRSVAFIPSTYQIGSPEDFSALDEESRSLIPDVYEKSYPPGPAAPFGAAGMVVEFPADVVFYEKAPSAKGQGSIKVEAPLAPEKAAARLAGIAAEEASGKKGKDVAVLGRYRTADVMSGAAGMGTVEPRYELVGVYEAGRAETPNGTEVARRSAAPWFVIAAALILALAAFPFALFAIERGSVDVALDGAARARALLEYMRYRLYVMGERPYGLSLSEWRDWCASRFGLDISVPAAAVESARYGGADSAMGRRDARAMRGAFEDALHLSFPMERTLLSVFDPIAAASYLRDRGALAILRALRGRKP